MIAQLSKRLASFFVCNKIIEEEDEEVYDYGLQLLLSTVANGLIALLIAIITGTVLQCFFYLAVFIVMRKTAGGYHAKTHLGCCCILVVVLICFIIFIKNAPMEIYSITTFASVVFSIIIILLFAPLEHENKPISDKDRINLRRKSILYIFVIAVLVFILAILRFDTAMVSISLGILTSSSSIMVAKVLKNTN